MGQKFAIVCRQIIPIHTVHIYTIESLLFFSLYIIEHKLSFFVQIKFHFGFIVDGSQFFTRKIHFLHFLASQNKKCLLILIGTQRCVSTFEFRKQFGCFLTQIVHPQIVIVFESR